MLRPLKTAYEYFALYSSLTLLGLICLIWSVFALPLYFLLPRRIGSAVGRRGIMSGFVFTPGLYPSLEPTAWICATSTP